MQLERGKVHARSRLFFEPFRRDENNGAPRARPPGATKKEEENKLSSSRENHCKDHETSYLLFLLPHHQPRQALSETTTMQMQVSERERER